MNKEAKVKLPHQPYYLAGVVVDKSNNELLRLVKGIVEEILSQLFLKNLTFSAVKDSDLSDPSSQKINNLIIPSRSLSLVQEGHKIGWLAEMNETAGQIYKFRNKQVAAFEIDLDQLVGTSHDLSLQRKYRPLPKFPAIERDLAIEVDWSVKWAEILKQACPDPANAGRRIQDDKSGLIKNVIFLSEFDLGEKKSLAFRVIYQADRTLKDEEVVAVEKRIIKMLEEKFGASLRK
jgi:phenylalanyl-tRNA synthetase beta chain